MSASEIVARDLYYRINSSGGKSSVRRARVWDAELFLAAQRSFGAKAEKPEDRFTISSATEAEFNAKS